MFVAAYPPPAAVEAMLARLADLRRSAEWPPWRETPAGQVHLTLQFIGDVESSKVDDVVESVERAVAGVTEITLAPRRLRALPARGPARLVALETDTPPPLRLLKERLATRLSRRPRRDAADRFLPHLTLCRFRAPARGIRLDEPVEDAPFPIRGIRLMRSTLHADGARHDEIATFGLSTH
jgi:2'-5' RNA ligase